MLMRFKLPNGETLQLNTHYLVSYEQHGEGYTSIETIKGQFIVAHDVSQIDQAFHELYNTIKEVQ